MQGRVIAVNKADKRGVLKKNVGEAYLREGWGLEGDAHAGAGERQVSILPLEAMALVPPAVRATIAADDYTENITMEGIALDELVVGRRLRIGEGGVVIAPGSHLLKNGTRIFSPFFPAINYAIFNQRKEKGYAFT